MVRAARDLTIDPVGRCRDRKEQRGSKVQVMKEQYEKDWDHEQANEMCIRDSACTAGIFKDCYNIIGGVDQAIPVDVYAPGCAIRPEAIILSLIHI